MSKRYRVMGHAEVLVTTVVEVDDDEELDEDGIIDRAHEMFTGIGAYCGNGGTDKLIGVDGEDDTISCPEYVEFDDCMLEDE